MEDKNELYILLEASYVKREKEKNILIKDTTSYKELKNNTNN